ncbi:MAG: cobyric acid synthase [Anaerolineales bacterium]|nr:cobyric acid synthase [Anaerolineales bacterium]
MTGKVLMLQGTSSSVGKSLLVAGLCHLYARRGVRVAPYKAQNMSNNAAVCPDGLEIGRAQAVQALASGLEPHVDMNPVLIKPEADSRSQVVVMGRPWQTLSARDYYLQKQILWKEATAALDRLRAQYELVIIEGAGSAAELNLKGGDIVNMAIARYADAPVLLAGDIDRGGIFAQLIGTVWLLEPEERELVKGLIVNKFRGDISLFADGVHILEEKSHVPVLGVVPYLHDLFIPEEDAVALENPFATPVRAAEATEIVVIHLPRIANFDDFDPLATEPGVRVRYVDGPEQIGNPAAIIIPGTKSTVNDLAWLRSRGFDEAIRRHAQKGGSVVGICGGYQMLGEAVHDPQHVESKLDSAPGLGLLPIETVFAGDKTTHQASAQVRNGPGWLADLEGQTVTGYEIHMGRTQSGSSWLEIAERSGQSVQVADGAASVDGKIWGCYVHGLFANENLRRAWLADLGWKGEQMDGAANPFAASLTRLADTLEETLDMGLLEKIVWES